MNYLEQANVVERLQGKSKFELIAAVLLMAAKLAKVLVLDEMLVLRWYFPGLL